ncbi:hypothetical protein DT075_24735 [Bacillus licheniformis]|nr:hypothetical protein DT075_24735 [Bacillus licheniformis]
MTNAQAKALDDILRDMASGYKMNRLLQGDVGSGKTAVAAIALYASVLSGFQGAMLRTAYKLLSYQEAVKAMHKPESREALKHARRRFVYEEFLLFQLKMQALRKFEREASDGISHTFRLVTVTGKWDKHRQSVMVQELKNGPHQGDQSIEPVYSVKENITVKTMRKLIQEAVRSHLPFAEDPLPEKLRDLEDVAHDERVTVEGKVHSEPSLAYYGKKRSRLTFRLLVGNYLITAVCFNRPYLKKKLAIGSIVPQHRRAKNWRKKYSEERQLHVEHNLQLSISVIKGVGTETEKTLNELGIYTVLDLLNYFPYRYDDYDAILSQGSLRCRV